MALSYASQLPAENVTSRSDRNLMDARQRHAAVDEVVAVGADASEISGSRCDLEIVRHCPGRKLG